MNEPVEIYKSKYIAPRALGRTCLMQTYEFASLPGFDVSETKDGLMLYKDNGAKILAVGHLDSVVDERKWGLSKDHKTFFSPQLDDRLGVHILLNVLPKYGLNYDILLTDSEEIGKSTARLFVPKKQYNWGFEIDRFGTDVALYKFFSSDLEKALRNFGFSTSRGSNTDINYLNTGCAYANFACAYYNNHSVDAFAKLDELDDQLDKIIRFFIANEGTHFPFQERKYTNYGGGYYNYNRTDHYRDDYWRNRGYIPANTNNRNRTIDDIKDNLEDGICDICNSELCFGLEKCSCCNMSKHGDYFIHCFGVCSRCLESIAGVKWPTIEAIINFDDININNAIDEVFVCLGGQKW